MLDTAEGDPGWGCVTQTAVCWHCTVTTLYRACMIVCWHGVCRTVSMKKSNVKKLFENVLLDSVDSLHHTRHSARSARSTRPDPPPSLLSYAGAGVLRLQGIQTY